MEHYCHIIVIVINNGKLMHWFVYVLNAPTSTKLHSNTKIFKQEQANIILITYSDIYIHPYCFMYNNAMRFS